MKTLKTGDLEFQERVYDMISGNLIEELAPESALIKSEFYPGSPCDQAYTRMLDAYTRICYRLKVIPWADVDVECIVNELQFISKQLGLKMYQYGYRFGSQEK